MKGEESQRPKLERSGNPDSSGSKSRGGTSHASWSASREKAYWPNEPTASQDQGRRRVRPTFAAPGVWVDASGVLSSELLPRETREARTRWGASYLTAAHGQVPARRDAHATRSIWWAAPTLHFDFSALSAISAVSSSVRS